MKGQQRRVPCGYCGTQVLPTDRYCEGCGAKFRDAVATPDRSTNRSGRRISGGTIIGIVVLVIVLLVVVDEYGETGEPDDPPRAAAPPALPTATLTAERVRAIYPPVSDPRDLWVRPGSLDGKPLSFEGKILVLRVADPGYGYELGGEEGFFGIGGDDGELYRTVIQVMVEGPDGSSEPVMVGYDQDPTGAYEGDHIRVSGELIGSHTGENVMGGDVTMPIVEAVLVEVI